MADPRPVRLRLSRAKGFSLQALSLATNGLPAVNVSRPGKHGNPFRVGMLMDVNGETVKIGSALHARTLFLECEIEFYFRLAASSSGPDDRRPGIIGAQRRLAEIASLRGKNLACWCCDGPCHADVLLEVANRPICEAV